MRSIPSKYDKLQPAGWNERTIPRSTPHAFFTIFRTHSPCFTRIQPRIHLSASRELTMVKIVSTGRVVKRDRQKAAGTLTAHAKQLSKINVISVFPPERRVK